MNEIVSIVLSKSRLHESKHLNQILLVNSIFKKLVNTDYDKLLRVMEVEGG